MPSRKSNLGELARLTRNKTAAPVQADELGAEMIRIFKESITKRQTKFANIADAWNVLVPPLLSEHCSMESLSKGQLTVLVDSASHLYELKQLLLAGLEKQLLLACKSAGLRKISLKRGRWYNGDNARDRRLYPL
jgi:Dna[CI] antecedent, DciA